jgi:hypothetical protein
MIVVSDTTPLNYLVLIDSDHLLPAIFGSVYAPPEVVIELKRTQSETPVREAARTGSLHPQARMAFGWPLP